MNLLIAECNRCGVEILAMECHIDHVHIFVSVSPTMSISNIMKHIKGQHHFCYAMSFYN